MLGEGGASVLGLVLDRWDEADLPVVGSPVERDEASGPVERRDVLAAENGVHQCRRRSTNEVADVEGDTHGERHRAAVRAHRRREAAARDDRAAGFDVHANRHATEPVADEHTARRSVERVDRLGQYWT